MFGKISDVCFLITNLCFVYLIVFCYVIPIYKIKKTAKEYKIIGGENVVSGLIIAIGAITLVVVDFIHENFIVQMFGFAMVLWCIFKIMQFAIFTDNKFGIGKNAIDLENVKSVSIYDNRAYDNMEFCFKDGTSKRVKISKKILCEVEIIINDKLKALNCANNIEFNE